MELSEIAKTKKEQILGDLDRELGLIEENSLDAAIRAWEWARQCDEIIKREGLLVKGERDAVRAHPLLRVMRQEDAFFVSVLRKLQKGTKESRIGRPTEFERFRAGKTYQNPKVSKFSDLIAGKK
jgi:hypothetical protein